MTHHGTENATAMSMLRFLDLATDWNPHLEGVHFPYLNQPNEAFALTLTNQLRVKGDK